MRSTRCPGPSKGAASDRPRRASARRRRTGSVRPRAASVMARLTISRRSASGRSPSRDSVDASSDARPATTTLAASLVRRRLEPLILVAGELGLLGQHVDDRRVEPPLEERQQLGPHAIPRDAHIVVRLVVDEGDALRPKIRLRARRAGSRAAGGRWFRGAGASTPSPREPGAAQEAQQKRLGLIVARVAERHDVGVQLRRAPARGTRGAPFARRLRSTGARGARAPRTSARSTTSGRPRRSASVTQNASSPSAAARSWWLKCASPDETAARPTDRARCRRCASATESDPPDIAATTRVSGAARWWRRIVSSNAIQ